MKPENPRPNNLGIPARRNLDDNNFTSQNKYKNISPKKNYVCHCPLCDLVGKELIIEQYNNFDNILIEDHSKRIFNPFFESVIK